MPRPKYPACTPPATSVPPEMLYVPSEFPVLQPPQLPSVTVPLPTFTAPETWLKMPTADEPTVMPPFCTVSVPPFI